MGPRNKNQQAAGDGGVIYGKAEHEVVEQQLPTSRVTQPPFHETGLRLTLPA